MMIYIFHSLIQKSFLKREANKVVKSSLPEANDFNFAKFDASETPLREIVDACLEVPMLENKKVVVVDNAFFLSTEKKSKEKINTDKDYDLFVKYLKKPIEETDLVLLVYSDKLDTRSKIYKALDLDKVKISSFAPLKEKDWEKYTLTLVQKRNIEIEPLAIKELAKRTLNDRDRLINEIEKLGLYANKISLNDVVTLVAEPIEDSAFTLSNALIKGDIGTSLFTFYDLMKIKNTQAEMLLMMLENQFRFMYVVQYMHDNGKDLNAVAQELHANEYRVKISYQNAKKIKNITKLFDDMYNLDLKIKSGQIDHVLALELFLINFKKNYF